MTDIFFGSCGYAAEFGGNPTEMAPSTQFLPPRSNCTQRHGKSTCGGSHKQKVGNTRLTAAQQCAKAKDCVYDGQAAEGLVFQGWCV